MNTKQRPVRTGERVDTHIEWRLRKVAAPTMQRIKDIASRDGRTMNDVVNDILDRAVMEDALAR